MEVKELTQLDLAAGQDKKAMIKYNLCYNNHVYTTATKDKSYHFANQLIDDGLALCGSPFYKLSNTDYSNKALDFLKLFT